MFVCVHVCSRSELRMLKAIVDEDGTAALRLKDDYLRDSKRREQLLETFPMSSVLKKVYVPASLYFR